MSASLRLVRWCGRAAIDLGARVSFGPRTNSIVDFNRGGHSSGKDDIGGHLIDMDANRDALGQADPGEDGIDGSNSLTVGLGVRDVVCAGDAVDVATHYLAVAHQFDLSRVAHADRSKGRLLKISVDPE